MVRVLTDPEFGGTEIVKEVWAETSALAAGMAEASEPQGTVLGLTITILYLGRCNRCHSYVEIGQKHAIRRGRLYCKECDPNA